MLEAIRHSSVQNLVTDPSFAPEPEDRRFDITRALGILQRRKWVVLGTVACIVGLSLLVTSQLEKRYTATALLAVDSRDAQLLGFEPGTVEGMSASSTVDTEVEIARSPAVLGRAANTLGLANWPEFAPKRPLLNTLRSLVGLGPREGATPPTARTFIELSDVERARLLKGLTERLQINRRGLTSIVSISATATSAEGSAQVANAIADAYLTEQIESKLSSTERAADFLRGRVNGIAADVTKLEYQIDTLLQTKLAETSSPETRALMAKLADAARGRDASASSLAGLQAAMKAQDYARLALLLNDQELTLARQRAALIDELAATGQQRVELARQKLAALDDEIRVAAEKQLSSIQAELTAADDRAASLRREIDAALTQQQLPKDFSVELFRLQRDLESRRALYVNFTAKLGQVEQQSDFNLPDSRIIAAAAPPDQPSYPAVGLITIAALVLSLIAGIGLAILRENYIGGVASIEQFEAIARIPVVAGVPKLPVSATGARPDAMIISQPLSAFSEAIRRARLGIEAYAPKGKLCLFVTSPLPGDGKTTLALSLARHAATTGRKTLLIDADLRHPSINKALDQTPEKSLIDFLADPTGKASEVPLAREANGLLDFVLGADASTVASDAMLMSDRFADLMKFARDNYDVVIVDTPPIGLVVDARIVAPYCDVGVFVVRCSQTSQHHIRASLRDLAFRLDMPICGVLNQIPGTSTYAYGYQRKYDRYYGAGAPAA